MEAKFNELNYGTGFVQTQDENVENEVELQVNFKPL
jgi:hypothetical protein